jgi:hypothetical protein
MEVSLLSPEVMLPRLNLYPIHYRTAFAFSISHTRSPFGSPCGSLSLEFDFCLGKKSRHRENYGLTTFRVSARVG